MGYGLQLGGIKDYAPETIARRRYPTNPSALSPITSGTKTLRIFGISAASVTMRARARVISSGVA